MAYFTVFLVLQLKQYREKSKIKFHEIIALHQLDQIRFFAVNACSVNLMRRNDIAEALSLQERKLQQQKRVTKMVMLISLAVIADQILGIFTNFFYFSTNKNSIELSILRAAFFRASFIR